VIEPIVPNVSLIGGPTAGLVSICNGIGAFVSLATFVENDVATENLPNCC